MGLIQIGRHDKDGTPDIVTTNPSFQGTLWLS